MAGERGRKRRWARRAALAVLVLFLAVAGLLVWRFRAELRSYQISQQYTSSQLEDQLEENNTVIQDAVETAPEINVRSPTEEERQALQDGTLTGEELAKRLVGGADSAPEKGGAAEEAKAQSGASAAGAQSPLPSDVSASAPAKQSDYSERLSALVAQVYVLREEYLNDLARLEANARADYGALPESERTAARLTSLAGDYIAKGTALEKECDGKMDAILTEMERLIAENEGDESFPDLVFDSYLQEKSLKKAWYMSKLEEKGLI